MVKRNLDSFSDLFSFFLTSKFTVTLTFSGLVFVTFSFYFDTVLDKLASMSFRMHSKTCMSYHTIYSSPILTECAESVLPCDSV